MSRTVVKRLELKLRRVKFNQERDKMPFCIKCGNRLLPNAKFCHRCGTTVKPTAGPVPMIKLRPAAPSIAPSPYKSPIAETYYETVLRPAAEEKLAKHPTVKRREAPTKPFEGRVKVRG